ncbi:MAG: hypothetical protein ACLFMM_06610 [Methanohalobium sp.]|uniref:hypothetical protein n=1 Tax=Methanohalobium sp. TaxID=2837493 RepID=UPI00397E49FD
MDIVISNDKTGNNRNLVGKKLIISDGLAEEKGFDRQICSAELMRESSVSYQLLVEKIEDNLHWIPKSKVVIPNVNRSDLFFLDDRVFELYNEVNDWRLNQKKIGVLTTIDATEFSQISGDTVDDVELVVTTGNASAWPDEVSIANMLEMYDNFWIQGENSVI